MSVSISGYLEFCYGKDSHGPEVSFEGLSGERTPLPHACLTFPPTFRGLHGANCSQSRELKRGWYGSKQAERARQQKRGPRKRGPTASIKVPKTDIWRRRRTSLINGAGKTGQSYVKMKMDPYLSPCTKNQRETGRSFETTGGRHSGDTSRSRRCRGLSN